MGGGHHGEPYEIPKYTVYNNWQECPHLVEHQNRLARLGLKDPFVRNYVHLYKPGAGFVNTWPQWLWKVSGSGFLPGIATAAAVIALEEGYSLYKKGHTSWSHEH
ncbi:NADH-ubiquinone oxidoreductase b12 subunit family domain-containing protein [Ditylenchus destructor]|uniref:NADH-ubiquinone oxidoreductase b12 subunit family domain-containing protein n=1 Tax=Ditylenchus destructor TaxID=166010 RepID=A0AAD4R2Q7_9BILA|nr:NADH-ubiquinone oxidoreductase b12 subunit family domain-containing protein [Ditylenchus destructor]